jgi:hypothetical protein
LQFLKAASFQGGEVDLMKTGTKSILFGVHQFLWHPFTVALAWRHLYGAWPSWRECVCILIHDIGYFGSPTMDGYSGASHPGGKMHPMLGAKIARRLFGQRYFNLTAYHSRWLANLCREQPSRLCWADKYSIRYEPTWFYLLRGRLSGEVYEFIANAPESMRRSGLDVWFEWYRAKASAEALASAAKE